MNGANQRTVTPRRGLRTLADAAAPLVGIGVFLAIWWIGTVVVVPHSSFVARFAPDRTLGALLDLVTTGALWPHLGASVQRVVVGLAISVAIGFPIGLAVGSVRIFARMSGPIFQFIRMVSPLSWTPLAIILLGVGDAPVYFLIAIGGIWPIVLNTSAGVAALDPRWIVVGRSLGANRWEIARTIVWPGIRPHVLTGIRLAVGLSWIILVPAEMLGVDSGLGYYILDTRDRLAYAELMAAIIVIGLCGFTLDSVTRWTLDERRGRPWSPTRLEPANDSGASSASEVGTVNEVRVGGGRPIHISQAE